MLSSQKCNVTNHGFALKKPIKLPQNNSKQAEMNKKCIMFDIANGEQN